MSKNNSLLAPATTFALFDDSTIRRERHNWEWFYSIVDIVQALTWSPQPSRYWTELKWSIEYESNIDLFANIEKVKLQWEDGKKYPTDVANNKTVLRIIQSIPSPRAEPLKQRLADIWNERIEELDDPEQWIIRARERALHSYRLKGMSDAEIKQRFDMIDSRNNFTDLLRDSWIQEKEYRKLTNVSYTTRAWMDAKEYKAFKWLDWKSDNLREHMSRTEWLLTQISEEAAKMYIEKTWAKWFEEIQDAVRTWWEIAKQTRDSFQKNIWIDPISPNNRLTDRQKAWRDKKKKLK